MILGYIAIDTDRGTIDTHRDSYKLSTVTVVSVRRPFLVSAAMLTVCFGSFAASFADLLYAHEIAGMAAAGLVLLILGSQVGQLKLLSRDLRGSELSDAIWGRYARLNTIRLWITRAMALQSGEPS